MNIKLQICTYISSVRSIHGSAFLKHRWWTRGKRSWKVHSLL